MNEESQSIREVVIDRKSPCQVTYYMDDKVFSGTSMHFSERGILIICKEPAPLNSKLRMQLLFPGFKNALELNGEVVWTNIYGPGDSLAPKGMGVKFTQVEREMEQLLLDFAGQYETLGSIYSCYYS